MLDSEHLYWQRKMDTRKERWEEGGRRKIVIKGLL